MEISVVVPCHGGAELTRRCIRSLVEQQGVRALEVLLVDNASPDDTRSLGEVDPCVRVLPQPENLGFAGGVNRGLAAARFPFVCVLNNDTQAAPELFVRLHRALASDARIAFAAPVSNHVKGHARLPVGGLGATAEGRAELADALGSAHGGLVQDVASLAGLCLFGRRATFARIGPFDERFGHGNFEDDDYCLRARLLGHRLVIARDAFLHHEGHATFRALGLDLGAQLALRGAQFAAKWSGDPAGAAVLAELRGDGAAAAAAASVAARVHPAWPDSDRLLLHARLAAGDFAAACAHGAAYLGSCPFDADAAIAQCRALLGDGRGDEARALLAWTLAHCLVSPETADAVAAACGVRAPEDGAGYATTLRLPATAAAS